MLNSYAEKMHDLHLEELWIRGKDSLPSLQKTFTQQSQIQTTFKQVSQSNK